MTLALYGKSRRRQILLVLLALAAVGIAVFGGSQAFRPLVADAAYTSQSATVNGSSAITIGSGQSIEVAVTVTLTSGSDWRSTEWEFNDSTPDSNCADTADHTTGGTSGPHTETFTITAPSAGTHDLYIEARENAACGGATGPLITLADAVVVPNYFNVGATVNGSTQAIVTPNASVSVVFTVALGNESSNDWDSTQWGIDDVTPDECADKANSSSNGVQSHTFNVTAPSTPGTYDLMLRASSSNTDCGSDSGPVFTLADAIVVEQPAPQPDLTVTKTAEVGGNPVSAVTQNTSFNWVWRVSNGGTANAVFGNGTTVLSDALPAVNSATAPAYGSPTVSGAAGVNCVVTPSGNARTLNCTAPSGVTLTPGSNVLTVTLPVTPANTGTLTNSSQACVDPSGNPGAVTESDEGNNACATSSVTVEAPSIYDWSVLNPGGFNQCIAPDIQLIIDNSGSIGDTAIATMKTNIGSMITTVESSLPGANWRAVAFRDPSGSFGSAGPAPAITSNAGGWQGDPTTNVIPFINGMVSDGYTPTAHGIQQGISNGTNDAAKPNLMIIITDGDPNVVYPGGNAPPADYPGGTVSAIAAADLARSSGWNTAVVVFGPGDGSSTVDSAQVMAALAGNDLPGPAGDNYNVGNVSNLGQAIVDSLLQNCAGTLNIVKRVDGVETAGWTFNVTKTGGNGTIADTPPFVTQDPGGLVTVDFAFPLQNDTVTVDVQEILLNAGYNLQTASCTGGLNNGTLNLGSKTVAGVQLGANSTVTCTFDNVTAPQDGSITVKKMEWNGSTWVPSDNVNPSWTFDIGGPEAHANVAPGATTPVAIGNGYTVTEDPTTGWYLNGWTKADNVANPATYQCGQPTFPVTTLGTNPLTGIDVSGDENVVVCAYNAPLQLATVQKTGTGLYSVDWSITKDVNDNDVSIPSDSGSTTTNYTVTVTKTYTGIEASGNITINNPNPVAIQVNVSDPGVTLGGDCADGVADIAANGQVVCAWSKIFPDGAALPQFSNTATVTTVNVAGENQGVTGWILFAKKNDGSKDTVDVSDNFAGSTSSGFPQGSTSESKTFNYDGTHTCEGISNWSTQTGQGSKLVNNTASINDTVGVNNSANETVEVTCQRPKLTVTKVVVGGTATANQWNLTIADVAGPTAGQVSAYVPSGLPQTVLESVGPLGYTLTSVVCTDSNDIDVDLTGAGLSRTLTMPDPDNDAVDVECVFTNTFDPATIKVTKDVNFGSTVNAGAYDTDFDICLFKLPADTTLKANALECRNFTGDGDYTFGNLLPGDYRIVEFFPNGDHNNWTVTGSNVDVTLETGQDAERTITNTFKPGAMTVQKNVVLGGAALPANSSFTICIQGPSYPAGGSWPQAGACQQLTNSGLLVWTNLLPGQYTVSETSQLPAGYWETPVISGSPFTVAAGAGASGVGNVTVTNTLKKASIAVTKTVNWNGYTPGQDDNPVFEVCITGPSYPGGNCKTLPEADGTPWVANWTNLVPGLYTVSETNPGSAWTVVVDGDGDTAQVNLDPGEQGNAGVTNTLKRGTLTIRKDVVWNGPADPNKTFEICIKGPSYPNGNEAGACNTFSDDESYTWENLIKGTYSVDEAFPGAEWGVTGEINYEVPAGSGVGGAVTNTRLTGDLTVLKTVNWSGSAPDQAQTFRICIQGPSYPAGGTWPQAGACQDVDFDGGSAVWNSLQTGTYTVFESFPQTDGGDWDATPAVVRTTGVEVVVNGTTPASTDITNTLKPVTLTITKVYQGGDPKVPTIVVNGNAVAGGPTTWGPFNATNGIYPNTLTEVSEVLPPGWFNSTVTFSGQCGQSGVLAAVRVLELVQALFAGLGNFDQLTAAAGAKVSIPPGQSCTVTFTNAVQDDLVVTKTGQGGYIKDIDWTVTKAVVGSDTVTVPDNGSHEFEFDIDVTRSVTYDNVQAVGTITVENPAGNDAAALLTGVSDDVAGTAITYCYLDGAPNAQIGAASGDDWVFSPAYALAPGATLICQWSTTMQQDQQNPPANFNNVATVTVASASPVLGGGDEAAIVYSQVGPSTGPETVDVTDVFNGADQSPLLSDNLGASAQDLVFKKTLTCSELTEGYNADGVLTATRTNRARLDGEQFTLLSNEVTVTINCERPKLTLVKAVSGPEPTGGHAALSAWTLHADTATNAFDLDGTTGVNKYVPTGSEFILSETGGDPRYQLDEIACVNGQGQVYSGPSAQPFAMPSDDVTCTFTNLHVPTTLTVQKVINRLGDSADTGEFAIGALGPTIVSNPSVTDVNPTNGLIDGATADAEVIPGGYTVAETLVSGGGGEIGNYIRTITCREGDAIFGGIDNSELPLAGVDVTLELGDDVVCTVTNTLKKGEIIVHKTYAGATAGNDDRPLVTVGDVSPAPSNVVNNANDWAPVEVIPWTPVDVSEELVPGWKNVDIIYGEGCLAQVVEVDRLLDIVAQVIGITPDSLVETIGMVAPGGTCHITFANEAYGTVIVEKVDASQNGEEWDFSVTGPQQFVATPHITGSDSVTYLDMPLGSYTAAETSSVYPNVGACPLPNPEGEGVYVSALTSTTQELTQPGQTITFRFRNDDCPVVLSTGTLVVEKHLDVNGTPEAGDPLQQWTVTVTGPEFPGGQQFVMNGTGNSPVAGRLILLGIKTGSYTITEDSVGGYTQTGLVVNGVTQAVSTTTTVAVEYNQIEEVLFYNQPLGSIRVDKVTLEAGTPINERGGWQITVTGCGITRTGTTNAAGVAVFNNLPVCPGGYAVTENASSKPGFVATTGAVRNGVDVEIGETTEVQFINERTCTTNCGTVTPTPPTPTPETPTPTNTPTSVPTNTPTEAPTSTPTPIDTVAGEITPGSGAQATPIAPNTGVGLFGSQSGGSAALLLLAILAITGGLVLLGLGRRGGRQS